MGSFSSKKIIVMLGAGGVGKTTSSIAVALAAAQQGKRVALLSIDPARRLADALGIKLSNKMNAIDFGQSPSANFKGTLHAAMLDQKAVFDQMVANYAPTPKVAQRILRDPLYKAASTNLAGPLEYMALARLRELAEDPAYDLVVLDTPPDTHALDFLARPNVLSGFMDNGVLKWLIKPFVTASRFGLGRMIGFGEKLIGGVASLTGVKALRDFGEFLILMQEVIDGFHHAGERVLGYLKLPSTAFVLVTVPTTSSTRAAAFLAKTLATMEFNLHAIVFNRCLSPMVAKDALSIEGVDALAGRGVASLRSRAVGEQESIEKLLKTVPKRTQMDSPNASKKTHEQLPIPLKVPEEVDLLHDLSKLLQFSQAFRAWFDVL